jgi:hypothetical protein
VILLDTDVLSAMMREADEPSVERWLDEQSIESAERVNPSVHRTAGPSMALRAIAIPMKVIATRVAIARSGDNASRRA